MSITVPVCAVVYSKTPPAPVVGRCTTGRPVAWPIVYSETPPAPVGRWHYRPPRRVAGGVFRNTTAPVGRWCAGGPVGRCVFKCNPLFTTAGGEAGDRDIVMQP